MVQLRERLLAHITRELAIQLGALLDRGRLEPQGRIHRGAPLHPQHGLVDELAVLRLRRLALGAPERFRHSHELVTLRFRNEAGQRQQLPTYFAAEACEVRAIRVDGA